MVTIPTSWISTSTFGERFFSLHHPLPTTWHLCAFMLKTSDDKKAVDNDNVLNNISGEHKLVSASANIR